MQLCHNHVKGPKKGGGGNVPLPKNIKAIVTPPPNFYAPVYIGVHTYVVIQELLLDVYKRLI